MRPFASRVYKRQCRHPPARSPAPAVRRRQAHHGTVGSTFSATRSSTASSGTPPSVRHRDTSKEPPLSFASRATVRVRAGTPGPLSLSFPSRRKLMLMVRSA